MLEAVVSFIASPAFAMLMGGLWLVSEALASIPGIQANSVFQAIHNFLMKYKRD